MNDSDSPVLRPPRVLALTLLNIASAIGLFGWLFFLWRYHQTHRLGAAHMFPQDLPFLDFYLYKPTFAYFHQAAFFDFAPDRSHFSYPPLAALLYAAFYSVQHKITYYIVFTLVLWALLSAWALHALRSHQTGTEATKRLLTLAPLGYPALFLLERGNLEVFVWAFVAAGLLCLIAARPLLASALFGIAAALKLYPILLLGLLLGRRDWLRTLTTGLLTAVSLTLLALWIAGPSIPVAARGFLGGILSFQQHYAVTTRVEEMRFDHSLFSLCKLYAMAHGSSLPTLSPIYYLTCALLFSTMYLVRIRRAPRLNQIVFFTVCMILLPPVSYEYTLVHLYVPLLLLLSTALAFNTTLSRSGVLALVSCTASLLPGDVLSFGSRIGAGQIQALLLFLTAASANYRFFSSDKNASSFGSRELAVPVAPDSPYRARKRTSSPLYRFSHGD